MVDPLTEPADPAELAAKYDRFALMKARRYRRRLRPADYDDVVQEARVAVLRAARAFDPARGFQFTTFAGRMIGWAVQAWLAKADRRGLTGDGVPRGC